MPSPFQALLPSKRQREEEADANAAVEAFVNDKESQSIVGNVFISIALMLLAAGFMWLFYWAFNRDRNLFITIFSAIMFAYAITITIITVIYRNKFAKPTFTFLIGVNAFVGFMTLTSLVFFAIRANRSGSGSSYEPAAANPYVSRGVQDYLGSSSSTSAV